MDAIRKLPASAGAEWLLGGFTLVRQAPVALCTLGALWGLFGSMVVMLGLAVPPLAMLLQLLLSLAGPVLFAGLVCAVREVAQGRDVSPAHLWQGVREGRVPALLATILPQAVAGLALGILLLTLVGTDQLQQLVSVSNELTALQQSGAQPTPEQIEALLAGLPVGGILLWLLLGVLAAAAVSITLFLAVPRIVFDRRGGLAAMVDSLRAGLANLPALIVFFLLTCVALFAVYFVLMVLGAIMEGVLGTLPALLVTQLLLMAAVMPLLAGAVYTAWVQVFGSDEQAGAPVPPPAPHSDRFEA